MKQKYKEYFIENFMVVHSYEFTGIGKVTLFPAITVLCWIVMLLLLPFIPFMILIVVIEERVNKFKEKRGIKPISYYLHRLFYKKGY